MVGILMEAPLTPIILCKYNLEAPYCHLHMMAQSVIKYICAALLFTLIYLQLTFGGSFSPAEWCVIINIITDVANDSINNPNGLLTKFTPPHLLHHLAHRHLSSPYPSRSSPPSPPQSKPPINQHGWDESYIDNILGVCLHIGENTKRTSSSILLTISLIAHPESKEHHPIPHNYMLSLKKWIVKGQQEELKTILGWWVDTH